jgi:hypothetical protein
VTAQASISHDGYALLPRLLSRSEVRALWEPVPGLRATRAVGACERPNNILVPLRWDDASVVSVLSDNARVRRIRIASGGHRPPLDFRLLQRQGSAQRPLVVASGLVVLELGATESPREVDPGVVEVEWRSSASFVP